MITDRIAYRQLKIVLECLTSLTTTGIYNNIYIYNQVYMGFTHVMNML